MNGNKLNGIIVVDKPGNISSARAVSSVKNSIKAKKVGHAGTLDPFAEGVLVCCVNQATRLARFLLQGKKKYVAELRLGEETDTQDLTGTVVSSVKPVDISCETIKTAFKTFEGLIEQSPPVYSALKHQGVPLYKLARRGNPIQKPPRRVKIEKITILDIDLPFIRFEVSCSAGTYIRTLAADIGSALGCGAHLTALKRIESSGFRLDQAISLSCLQDLAKDAELSKQMINMADALPNIPTYKADARLIRKIRHGKMIATDDLIGHNRDEYSGSSDSCRSYLKIVDLEGDLIAILNQHKNRPQLDYCCVFAGRDM
jgi:tRNA pseudouridine55 synthase